MARRVAACSLIVVVPMVFWLLRDLLTTGEFTRHEPPESCPVSTMTRDVVDTVRA